MIIYGQMWANCGQSNKIKIHILHHNFTDLILRVPCALRLDDRHVMVRRFRFTKM